MPFGYTAAAWIELTDDQRIDAVFAQLDANLVFEGNAAKAESFLESVQYLRYHRHQAGGSNNRSFTYSDYAADVERASRIVSSQKSGVHRTSFVRAVMQ